MRITHQQKKIRTTLNPNASLLSIDEKRGASQRLTTNSFFSFFLKSQYFKEQGVSIFPIESKMS